MQPKMAFFHDFLREQPLNFIFNFFKKISFVFSTSETPIRDCTLKFQNSSEMKHPSGY